MAFDIGDLHALEVYKKLRHHTLQQASLVNGADKLLYYYPYIDLQDGFEGEDILKFRQIDGDLGSKMHDALSNALSKYEKAIIIGTDCPYITAEMLMTALDQLDNYDTVLGPAEDGGYYLIGMKKAHASLFTNIPWSTDNVLQLTLDKIGAAALSHVTLPTLSDIDYASDWQKYLQSTQSQQ